MLKDLRRVAYVVEVERAGSFTGAAQALGIAQSTVTKGIAEIEALVGTDLFLRTGSGACVTDAGRRFVRKAQTLLRDANALMEESSGYRMLSEGHLRIGVSPLASLHFLTSAIDSFCRARPQVQVSFEPCTEAIAVPRMMTGDLDLVIAAESSLTRWEDLRRRRIVELDCAFMVRKDHPLIRSGVIEKDILGLPMVVPTTADPMLSDMAARATENGLFGLRQHYRCDDFQTILAIVNATDACSPLLEPVGSAPWRRSAFHVFRGIVEMPRQRLLVAQPKNRRSPPIVREILRFFDAANRGPR